MFRRCKEGAHDYLSNSEKSSLLNWRQCSSDRLVATIGCRLLLLLLLLLILATWYQVRIIWDLLSHPTVSTVSAVKFVRYRDKTSPCLTDFLKSGRPLYTSLYCLYTALSVNIRTAWVFIPVSSISKRCLCLRTDWDVGALRELFLAHFCTLFFGILLALSAVKRARGPPVRSAARLGPGRGAWLVLQASKVARAVFFRGDAFTLAGPSRTMETRSSKFYIHWLHCLSSA